MKSYAGIGSRSTPKDILSKMESISKTLAKKDYTLRSGGQIGADEAFRIGAEIAGGDIELMLPWPGFRKLWGTEVTAEAILTAEKYHPNWKACNPAARALHGRNSMIILGENLNDPVDFVVCWTKNGKDDGGTGLGIRMAWELKIPVFNLYNESALSDLKNLVKQS